MLIYLVTSCTDRGYDGQIFDTVVAYTNQNDADEHARLANEYARNNEDYLIKAQVESNRKSPYDPLGDHWDWRDVTYYVEEVNLLDKFDVNTSEYWMIL